MTIPAWLERTELLLGTQSLQNIASKHVLIVGLGGVGSFAAEFLVRSGIGYFTIVDGDVVDVSNINRQLQATHATVGQSKAELMRRRMQDINPNASIHVRAQFLKPEDMPDLLASDDFDAVLDCIDSITPKLVLISECVKKHIPIISAMGAGGKMLPSKVCVDDIRQTHHCKMAYYIRKRLKNTYNLQTGVWAVYSQELQKKEALKNTNGSNFKKSFYGTCSWMPALFGIHAAAKCIELFTANSK